ncbi:MAG: PHP domain-containing protein [Fibrobacterota bacterium]
MYEIKTDLHVHTNLSDGKLTPSEVVEASTQLGYKIAVTDHISPYQKIKDTESFDNYLRALEPFDIHKGGEFCIGFPTEIPESSFDILDLRIGSMHSLYFGEGMNFFFWNRSLRFPDIPLFIDKYCRTLIEEINRGFIDIIGHPFLLPVFLWKHPDKESLFPPELLDEIFKAAASNGTAIEVSGRWKTPCPTFVDKALRAGVKLAFGSDSHNREDLCGLDYCREIISKFGIKESEVYVPDGLI